MTQVDKHLCEYAVINVNTLTNIWLSVCLVCTEYNVLAWVSGIHWFFLLPNLGWAELRKTQHAASYFVFSSSHCIDLQRLPLHTGSGGACCFESLKAETCATLAAQKMSTAPQQHLCIQTVLCSSLKLATLACIQVVLLKQNINKPQTSERRNLSTLGGGGNCVAYLGNQMIITCNVICQLDFIPA